MLSDYLIAPSLNSLLFTGIIHLGVEANYDFNQYKWF